MTSPITPGSDAVLREWAVDLVLAAHMNDPTMNVYARLRYLCEAVAAAERERAAMATFDGQIGDPRSSADHAYNLALSDANRVIRSLRGLPEIGRPGK